MLRKRNTCNVITFFPELSSPILLPIIVELPSSQRIRKFVHNYPQIPPKYLEGTYSYINTLGKEGRAQVLGGFAE